MDQVRQAARWNPLIQQGSSFLRTLKFSADISELGFRGQLRTSHQAADVAASYTFEKLDAHTLLVSLAPAVTEGLAAGEYVHDIEAVVGQDEFVMRLLEGRARVTPEVTR